MLHTPERAQLSVDNPYNSYNHSRPYTSGHGDHRSSLSSASSYSTSSNTTVSSWTSRSRSRTSYASSTQTRLEHDVPHLTKTPWELERNKKISSWRRSKADHVLSSSVFKRLPREVYDCIVEQLEYAYSEDQECSSCYLKDLCSLALTSRAWDRAATLQLYRKVQLSTNEDHPKMPKLNIRGTGRLKLLRRTLRERQSLARHVRELHLPDYQRLYQNATIEREEIINLVASLVMTCPNLEKVVGFHIPFTHTFDRLSYALSTRKHLKERVWLLADSGLELDSEDEEDPANKYYHAANDPMERFLQLNAHHPEMTTLVLHQQRRHISTQLSFRAIIGTFRQLPSLRHLSVSGLSSSSFSNMTLNALPPHLESLRLENLPGINDKGLQRFASSGSMSSLSKLSLININITNLTTLSFVLSPYLPQLVRFILSQQKAPNLLPSDTDIPTLQSKNLTYLHWELRSQASPPAALLSPPNHQSRGDILPPQFPFTNSEPISCLATSLLATSIRKGKFPSLTTLRAPHDPQGLLQGICKPRASALLKSDSALLKGPLRQAYQAQIALLQNSKSEYDLRSTYNSTQETRTDSAMSSPVTANFPLDTSLPPPPPPPASTVRNGIPRLSTRASTATLRSPPSDPSASIPFKCTPAHSRLLAQSRILSARKTPLIHIKVIDPEGILRTHETVYSFMGSLGSKIEYEIRPDRQRESGTAGVVGYGAEDEKDDGYQWVTEIGDVVGEWEVVGGGSNASWISDGCHHLGRGSRKSVRVPELF